MCLAITVPNDQYWEYEPEQGILQNGKTIAVKKLSRPLEEDQFQNEVTYLIGVKHENVVQLLGYCAETQSEVLVQENPPIWAEKRDRLICFEYLNNKSLDEYISGMVMSFVLIMCFIHRPLCVTICCINIAIYIVWICAINYYIYIMLCRAIIYRTINLRWMISYLSFDLFLQLSLVGWSGPRDLR